MKIFSWILTILVPMAVMFIPTGEVFTETMRFFVAITLAFIICVAFENLPYLIPSIILPLSYVLTNLAPASAVFAPWMTFIPWMFMGGFLFANVLQRTGLLKRIAYWFIIKSGGSYNGILYALMFAGIVLNLLLPRQIVIPMAALTFGLCIALNLGRSKEAAGIMLTGAFAALLPAYFIYNPNLAIILGVGSEVAPEYVVTWGQYFYHKLPAVFWCFFMVFVTSKVFKPDKKINVKDYVTEEYSKLGPMSIDEKKGILVCLALFVFLVTSSIHGIEMGWGFAIAACLAFLPGIAIGKEQDIKEVNFPMIFFITACMAMGQVANYHGMGAMLSIAFMPLIEDTGPTTTIMLVWGLVFVVNILLTPLAIMASLTAPLTQVALDVGINPIVFYYTIYQAIDQVLLPYQYTLYLIFFTYGLIRMSDFIKIFAIKMILHIIFMVAVLIPWWKFIGLI